MVKLCHGLTSHPVKNLEHPSRKNFNRPSRKNLNAHEIFSTPQPLRKFLNPPHPPPPPKKFSTPPHLRKFLNPPPPHKKKYQHLPTEFLYPPENITTPLEKISDQKKYVNN